MATKTSQPQQSPSSKEAVYLDILEPEFVYPFDLNRPLANTFVRHSKRYSQSEYEQTKANIIAYSKLAHPCLIRLIKAMESKKEKVIELIYEYVPCSLKSKVAGMKK